MKTLYLAGAGIAALLAIPVFAQMGPGGPDGPDGQGPITRAEVKAKIDARFAEADANRDGVVTKAEWDAARAAKKAERKDAAFDRIDANRDGQISKDEWDAPRPGGMAEAGPPPEGAGSPPPGDADSGKHGGGHRGHGGPGMMMGGDMFDRMDANHDGKVTLAEAEAKPLEMFDKADTNHDGIVTPEERKAAWQAMRADWKAKRG
jgi:hypothetical protein